MIAIDLPSLKSLTVGSHGFSNVSSSSLTSTIITPYSPVDLPSLSSISLGFGAFSGPPCHGVLFPGADKQLSLCSLRMIDLPSLHDLNGTGRYQFANCTTVELKSGREENKSQIDIPEDVIIDLPAAFGNVHTLAAESGLDRMESTVDAFTMQQFIQSTSYHFFHSRYSNSLSSSLLSISCNTMIRECNTITSINLSDFPNLQSFVCPPFSFPNVSVFKCENHASIQFIQIGKSSLCGANGQFIISDCPQLSDIMIGSKSCVMFTDYRVESAWCLVDVTHRV